jgi:hypothetical protein
MSIDVTPQLLTSIRPEMLEADVIAGLEADRQPTPGRLDRAMNRVLGSRAIWLAPVLLVQAVLSLRPSTTLTGNEAVSINAGHQLIAHLLHGTPTPDFGSSFSGVPALYAVPAALIGDVGGVTLVRLASSVLALIATVFLYFATRRLFGQGSALIAGAVLGLNAFTLFIARFASADALCVALLTAGLWLAVASAERPRRALWLGPCLVLAGAASYLALPFIPAVLVVVAVHSARTTDGTRARRCVGFGLGSLAISAGLAILAASPRDLSGLRATLLDRHPMTPGAMAAMHHQFWTDLGPLLVVGAFAVALAVWNRLVAGLLVLTALVLTAAQVHLGTANPAHDSFDLVVVFIAPLVGVTGMALLRRGPLLGLRVPLAIGGMTVLLAAGVAGSSQMARSALDHSTLPAPQAHDTVAARVPMSPYGDEGRWYLRQREPAG